MKLYNKSDRAVERIEENRHFLPVEKKQDGNQAVAIPNWHPEKESAYFLNICAKDDLSAASQQKQPDNNNKLQKMGNKLICPCLGQDEKDPSPPPTHNEDYKRYGKYADRL